jgi:nucleotide-binding universal stress UspA family protein
LKILIAMEQSVCSDAALNSVLLTNWSASTDFEVMTVVAPVTNSFSQDACYLDSLYEAAQETKREAYKFVDQKSKELKKIFPSSKVIGTVCEGAIADAILGRAEAADANLIVVGTHSRKGINRLLSGSVAEKIAAGAHCCVEIVRVKDSSLETHSIHGCD